MRAIIIATWILGGMSSVQAAPYGFDELVSQVQKTASLNEWIPLLPADFKQSPILIYHTRGLQKGTPETPRVILFSKKNPNLILGLSGDPTDPRFEAVESIEFLPESSSFVFHQIYRSEEKWVVEKNIQSCKACHGLNQPHPNFDSFRTWPGVFGNYQITDAVATFEPKLWARFQASIPQHPRYELAGATRVRSLSDAFANNVEFGMHLGALNAERIYKEIQSALREQPEYRQVLTFLLTGDLKSESEWLSLLPQATPEDETRFSQLLKQTRELFVANFEKRSFLTHVYLDPELLTNAPVPSPDHDKDRYLFLSVSRLRYVYENRMKQSMAKWPLTVEIGTYRFAESQSAGKIRSTLARVAHLVKERGL